MFHFLLFEMKVLFSSAVVENLRHLASDRPGHHLTITDSKMVLKCHHCITTKNEGVFKVS